VLQAGDVALDPAAHTAARAGRDVELTAREFALLRFMMENRGEVLTRTQLLEHVWDENYDGPSNVVDVYVGYLRRKLERPFDRALIKTVRGVGYTLEPE
jgi:DNA-binding response OmpR family regulator